MDPTSQISNGLQQVSLDPAPRKKKTARAYHNLTPSYSSSPTLPQEQFTPAASPFQPQNTTHQPFFTPGGSMPSMNGMATPPMGQFAQESFPNGSTMSPAAAARASAQASQTLTSSSADSMNVPYCRMMDQSHYLTKPFKSLENVLPPTSVTRMQCFDQSTATPQFARLSLYNIPANETLRASSRLPLGLTVRPFAPQDINEEAVPEIDLTHIDGPPRCRRCRTYVNPYMKFTHEQKFICNMCKFPNPVQPDYTCALDSSGRRLDILQRPELCKGVVDFLVPESYWVEEGQAPSGLHHMFLIDVSAPNEVITATTEAIRSLLHELPIGARIGIVTYDQQIHFYNLESDRPQVIVATDLEDAFVPIHEGLFVDPQEHSNEIHNALNHIDEAYAKFKSPEVAYGAALKYALEALKLVGGGKVTATLTKLPTWGPGGLTNPNNADAGISTFKCSNEYYQRLADEYIDCNIGLDLFVVCQGAVALIDSANVVFKTSGTLKLFNNFIPERDERQYFQEFTASVKNSRGYQAQMKVRCSNGLQVSSYYGNFDAKGANDPKLPIVSSDQQYSVLFSYDGKLDPSEDVYFQTALLYTSTSGQRRVRVINVWASATDKIADVFAFADQDTAVDIIIKNCMHYISKQQPTEVKQSTTTKVIDILTQYRLLVSHTNVLPTQLIVPDSLNTLAAFISCFQKSKVFKNTSQNNTKVYDYYQLNSLPLERLMYHLYPSMIGLISLDPADCTYDQSGLFQMPLNTRASHQFVAPGTVFTLFTGSKLYLFVHAQASPLLLSDLFGVNNINELSPTMNELPVLDTQINLQARNIVQYFQEFLRLDFLAVQLMRQGIDGAAMDFGELLMEDRALDKTESITEFVSMIHKQIRQKVDETKTGGKASYDSQVNHDDSTLTQRFVHF